MTRRATALQRLPKRSDHATRESVAVHAAETAPATAVPQAEGAGAVLSFQVEPLYAIARELPPLFERHWRELALDQDKIPLDPDWDSYLSLALIGKLHVFTARHERRLVGYIFNLVSGSLHYRSTLHAELEMFWLDPAYRQGWEAWRWFRANEKMLRELGVVKVMLAEKRHFMDGRLGLLLTRLGYMPIETNWSKVL